MLRDDIKGYRDGVTFLFASGSDVFVDVGSWRSQQYVALLKKEVEEHLEEDEEEDEGDVSVREERALCRRLIRHSPPQGVDAPGRLSRDEC